VNATVLQGDCLEVLRALPDCSVDAVVTDPPYGLSFMGRKWDYDVPGVEVWAECLRVLKPGGHLLAFAGTRTQHRMCCRIEDAGFEIRDMIAWVYGSGFPKSLDVSKAIDASVGAERKVVGSSKNGIAGGSGKHAGQADAYGFSAEYDITYPSTEAAKQWHGWGTALKPALEPITVARKPLCGTVAANVLEWGTGAMNIDGARVPTDPSIDDPRLGGAGTWGTTKMAKNVYEGGYAGEVVGSSPLGRWPANMIHDGSEEVLACFPESNGSGNARTLNRGKRSDDGWGMADQSGSLRDAGSGSAARFFYCPKASKADRDEGCGDLEMKRTAKLGGADNDRESLDPVSERFRTQPSRNNHPTVKPTDLMRYLCRLVTPPGGVVLDPFTGSGSTGKAAALEGFRFIGIEREAKYVAMAQARIAAVQPPLFT